MMELTDFIRKSFTVKAVEVTFENTEEVAKWCGGKVVTVPAKILGAETELPAVRLLGQGDNRGKEFTATLGCYVVELKGSFRVYKPAAFFSAFEQKVVLEKEEDVDLQDYEVDEHEEEVEPFVAQSFIPVSPGQI